MKALQLSLKKNWFEMTKSGEKTEDYRDITPFWCNRLMLCNEEYKTQYWWKYEFFNQMTLEERIENIELFCSSRPFSINIMTLGYPKETDKDRILKYKHEGIEIRTGNPNWGAEPNKIYFVIKHGGIHTN